MYCVYDIQIIQPWTVLLHSVIEDWVLKEKKQISMGRGVVQPSSPDNATHTRNNQLVQHTYGITGVRQQTSYCIVLPTWWVDDGDDAEWFKRASTIHGARGGRTSFSSNSRKTTGTDGRCAPCVVTSLLFQLYFLRSSCVATVSNPTATLSPHVAAASCLWKIVRVPREYHGASTPPQCHITHITPLSRDGPDYS